MTDLIMTKDESRLEALRRSTSGRAKSVRAAVTNAATEVHWIVRVLLSSMDRFYWDNGFSKAASLAYTSLLSLVPLTALCFGILGAFLQTETHTAEVQRFLFRQFVPGGLATQDLLPYIQEFSIRLRAVNIVVIATLVVTCLLLLNSIEYALNQVWQVYESRSIMDRVAIFCAIIVLIPFFAVSGYYTTTKVQPFVAGFGLLAPVYEDLLPLLIDFLAYAALYYLVPKAPVRITPAAFGGLLASAMFGVAKYWFAVYIVRFSSYETVYGTIALVPIFLFWLYISWTIVLFGAEVSYQAQNLPRTGLLWKRSLMTVGDGAMILSMQAMVLIARAFITGEKLPNELEVAETLGCSSVVLKPSLDALEQAGLIMRGEGRDMPLLLMRSPEMISVDEIHDAVFKKRSSMILGEEMRRMYDCYAHSAEPSKVTLAGIVGQERSTLKDKNPSHEQ